VDRLKGEGSSAAAGLESEGRRGEGSKREYYTFKNLTENILIGLEADDFAAAAENL